MANPDLRLVPLHGSSKNAANSVKAFHTKSRLVLSSINWAGRFLGKLASKLFDDLSSGHGLSDRHCRIAKQIVPRLTALEPRIVLNATAELSAINGLLIFGDSAHDEIRIQTLSGGDAIQLLDASGMIVPIEGHYGGDTGSPTDPLAVSAIRGNLITVDLGDGNDLLHVELPDAINLNVLETAGDDRIVLSLQPNVSPSPATSIAIESETIQLSPFGSLLQFADRNVSLIGNVVIGSNAINNITEITVGSGEFEIQGKLTLEGSTRWVGSSGDLLWSDAVISATSPGIQLLIEFDDQDDSLLDFGVIDDSAGDRISNLGIVSASEVSFQRQVHVEQALTVDSANRFTTFGNVFAGSMEIRADHLSAVGGLEVDHGVLLLVASERLDLHSNIANSTDGFPGAITLSGTDLLLSDTIITSRGGDILLSGVTRLSGDVMIESAFGSSTQIGGDVDWIGRITNNNAGSPANLVIHTNGTMDSGHMVFHAGIGGIDPSDLSDLNSLVITTGDLSIHDIGVRGGAIHLSADTIQMAGSTLRASAQTPSDNASLHLVSGTSGEIVLQQTSTRLTADGNVLIDGNLRAEGSNGKLEITSNRSVQLNGQIRGGSELSVVARAAMIADADFIDWNNARFAAADGIWLGANRTTTQSFIVTDSIDFENLVVFSSHAVISASIANFNDAMVVTDNHVVELDARVIDSTGPAALVKQGAGELALRHHHSFESELVISEGTLRVDGVIDTASQVHVSAGAVLSGSGTIDGAVHSSTGTLAPSAPGSSTGTGRLSIGSLSLSPDTIYQVDIDGTVIGHSYDSIGISESVPRLAGAILKFDFSTALANDTEFLLIQNDTHLPIDGYFGFMWDENGNPLTTARELTEGALVSNRFGASPGGTTVVNSPAYITYFGGDGNDVAIVIAGDHQQVVDRITLVDRNRDNLEIRTGNSLENAQLASPTVRPIAGLQGNSLVLNSSVPLSELYLDINGFVGSGANALNHDSDIVFNASSSGSPTNQGDAAVYLFDQIRSSLDSPERFEFSYVNADELELGFRFGSTSIPDYRVIMHGVNTVDLALPSSVIVSTLTAGADHLVVQSDLRTGASNWELGNGLVFGRVRFEHPTESLSIDGGGHDDMIRIDSFGPGFNAVPTLVGGNGSDTVLWNASVVVGQVDSARDLLIDAESVTIQGDIRLIGDGAIEVIADSELTIRSRLDSSAGQIVIVSGAQVSDLASSLLQSMSTQTAIALLGGDYRIGGIHAVSGTVTLGGLGDGESIGSVVQTPESGIDAKRMIAHSRGTLDLRSTLNLVDEIEFKSTGDALYSSSSDVVSVAIEAGGDVVLRAAGAVELRSVFTEHGTILVSSGGPIHAQARTADVHIAGAWVRLSTGIAFPGQSLSTGVPAPIGSETIPIRVSVSEQFDATTSRSNGSIFIDSPRLLALSRSDGVLPIGLVNAGLGRVTITASQIEDDDHATDPVTAGVDLVGLEVLLHAQSGIGASRKLTATGLATLEAVTESGSIALDLVADRSVNLKRVETFGGQGAQIDLQHFGSDRLSITNVINHNGDVTVLTERASIDVLLNSNAASILVGGDGDLQLKNLNDHSDITIRGQVISGTGDVRIAAQRNLVFLPAGRLSSVAGDVSMSAGNHFDSVTSVVSLQDGSTVDSGNGMLRIDSLGDVFVSSLRSNAFDSAIMVTSMNGSMIDAGDQDLDMIAAQGSVYIDVAQGIGFGNSIETEIGRLTALVRGTGGLQIVESSELELVDVVTKDGDIDVTASGTLTVRRARSLSAGGFDTEPVGDVRLSAIGVGSDLLIESITAGIAGIVDHMTDVELVAGDDILRISSDSLIVADDLKITSMNGTADPQEAVHLQTDVHDIELTVLGSARGDVRIDEHDSIHLASSDRRDDREVVATANGGIRIQAGGSIIVNDFGLVDDAENLRDDVEISAGGSNGRLLLIAGDAIQMGDAVQLYAEQSVAGAVLVQAPSVELGIDFQIETGSSIGVARWFAPRPQEGLMGTAFYDATTVTTNRLEQAAVNDATGILSIAIGNAGERGLTIIIDWGAATDRFQQIDGISGDDPPLTVEHLYLERDILESQLNGRHSATDPLQVRFSVRHHDSIVVMGQSIQQLTGERQLVEGELLSSTDDPFTEQGPATPDLENGGARFVIPALSIPVAFFPVRDVIPTIEQDPIVISHDQRFVVLGAGFEAAPSVASSTTVREEYFQIRVLSPDPEGADLIPPVRLPDDIIGGDKLKQLFQSLPDGRYDLQYVLGDGNVRSILNVDLRDGKPIVPGNDVQGGTLRLMPVLPESEAESSANRPDNARPDNARFDDALQRSGEIDESFKFESKQTVTATSLEWVPTKTSAQSFDPLVLIQPSDGSESRLSVAGRLRQRILTVTAVAMHGQEEGE